MLPNGKQVIVLEPQDITGAATGTANIDTLGYDYLSVDMVAGTAAATTLPTTFKFGESDDTVVTNFADITALTGGVAAGNWTIPEMDIANTNQWKFNIDLRPRKRYLRLTFSPITNHRCCAMANLFRGDATPITAATAGTDALVNA